MVTAVTFDKLASEILTGDRMRDADQVDLAIAHYAMLCEKYNNNALPFYKLGTAQMRTAQYVEAEKSLRHALELCEEYTEAINNLSIVLVLQGKNEEAIAVLRSGLARFPDFPAFHIGLGKELLALHEYDQAIYHFKRSAALQPTSSRPLELLGTAFRAHGYILEALSVFKQALQISPGSADLWNHAGTCYYAMGEPVEAEAMYKKAIDLQFNHSSALQNYASITNYYNSDLDDSFLRHKNIGEVICKEAKKINITRPVPRSIIRVGLLSGDLRRHSVASFILGPLAYFDKEKISVSVYYTHKDYDRVSEIIDSFCDKWTNVSRFSDLDIASAIAADGVDILFDLSGHTTHSRPGVLAAKPARMQVSWIGYPATTGLPTVDYRLVDEYSDPAGAADIYFTERLWRVPGCFLCYTPLDDLPPVRSGPEQRNGFITFGSFNTRSKIGTECVRLWASVLREIPDSRLVLKSYVGFQERDARNALLSAFEKEGVARSRIDIFGRIDDDSGHLEAYGDVDVALDTFPYHGTTTTCEALVMGVPVITLAGDRHVSRVGVSLLTAAGYERQIALTEIEYVRVAQQLAGDRGYLRARRFAQRPQVLGSRLCDGREMAKSLEGAMMGMLGGPAD